MAYYRLYFLVSVSGQIERFHEFEAIDDDEAIAHAEKLRGPRPMELWAGNRKVKRWPMNFGAGDE